MRAAPLLLVAWAGILGVSSFPDAVVASPMEDSSLGGAVFTGPTSGHASSFFVNPAALGLSGPGSHLHMGGSGQLTSLYIDRNITNLDGTERSGESVSNHTITPGGIVAYYDSFRDNTAHFGLALYTPSVQRFPSNEEALSYHSEGGQLTQGMLTLAGSYGFAGNRFLVGLGISIGYSSLQLKFSRDSALDGGSDAETGINSDCGGSPCGYENPEAREHYEITVGNPFALGSVFALKNISASVGVAYKLPDGSWLGLGYVALPGAFGKLSLSGTATVTRSPRDGGLEEEATAEVGFRMAQMVFLGYRRAVHSKFDLTTQLRWQDWSRHDQFDVRLFGGELGAEIPEWMPRYRGMHDTFRVSAGIESNDGQRHRFGARLRFESSSAESSAASAMLIPGSSITLATGTELKLADQWTLGIGYELGWTPRAKGAGSAFDPTRAVACVDSGYDFDECAAARDGRAISTASGNYQQLRHGAVLSLRYDSL